MSRQDVDLLVVGNLGEPEAARLAIEAVETGRLVLAGLAAANVAQVVERLTTAPADENEPLARPRVAAALRGLIAQRLVATAGGKGRRPAGTLLRVGPETRVRLADGSTAARDARASRQPVVRASGRAAPQAAGERNARAC